MRPEALRQYGYDNIRFLLILFVVFAHLLELLEGGSVKECLYLTIYTFHMPVFLFLSGYFGRFSVKKLLRTGLLYLLFQFLYQSFGDISAGRSMTVQFHTPDWIMWYLPVLLYCHLLLPALDRLPYLPVIAVSIGTSLALGYCGCIGYTLSASRFFVFCPYFILGHFAQTHQRLVEEAVSKAPKAAVPLLLAVNLVFCLLLIASGSINAHILYGSYSYEIGYGPFTRLTLYALGFSWTSWFLILGKTTLNRRIPLVSTIGRNTLPIYLLHGFAVKLIRTWDILPDGLPGILSALTLSILLAVLLGNGLIFRSLSPRGRSRSSAISGSVLPAIRRSRRIIPRRSSPHRSCRLPGRRRCRWR